jgi:hypothetical protein
MAPKIRAAGIALLKRLIWQKPVNETLFFGGKKFILGLLTLSPFFHG